MKRIESQTSAAKLMKSTFEDEWREFVFDEQAQLVLTEEIPEGPLWMVNAKKGKESVLFVWETVTKYAYPCLARFSCEEISPLDDYSFKDCKGMKGTVIERNDEICIIYE